MKQKMANACKNRLQNWRIENVSFIINGIENPKKAEGRPFGFRQKWENQKFLIKSV